MKAFLVSGGRGPAGDHPTIRSALDGLERTHSMTGAWRRRSWIVLPWSEKGSGDRAGRLVARDRAHTVVMTGSCFRGDAEPMLTPEG